MSTLEYLYTATCLAALVIIFLFMALIAYIKKPEAPPSINTEPMEKPKAGETPEQREARLKAARQMIDAWAEGYKRRKGL